jgi:hypothetical protein
MGEEKKTHTKQQRKSRCIHRVDRRRKTVGGVGEFVLFSGGFGGKKKI